MGIGQGTMHFRVETGRVRRGQVEERSCVYHHLLRVQRQVEVRAVQALSTSFKTRFPPSQKAESRLFDPTHPRCPI